MRLDLSFGGIMRILAGGIGIAMACFFSVHFQAKRAGLLGIPRAELPRMRDVMRERGHLFLPVLTILAVMCARLLSHCGSARLDAGSVHTWQRARSLD
jgi:TRAP-type uncharacterized transport system fused permease subunit